MSPPDVHATIDAIWRMESARLIGALVRMVHDVGVAEELAQEALVSALQQWPRDGIPDRPGAWLMATAKHRAVDHLRRGARTERTQEVLSREPTTAGTPDLETALDEDVGDDLLRLILIACHPVLSTEARVALTLRLLGGLTTGEIARAFLTSEPTIAQRIVRAKRTLSEAEAAFEVPRGEELAARLASVLEVIYLVFNEGYSATRGEDWMRPALCEEALRLGRILAAHVPDDPEVHGLVALMALQASRTPARVDARGEPVLLLEQNRARWDGTLIQLGFQALARAEALSGTRGPYALQAAIAACHARARAPEQTDWRRIATLYDELFRALPTPVVALNRAVAVGMADGPGAALPLVDALAEEPAMKGYHLLPSVRGDLLMKLGRGVEAKREFERAASLTQNERERKLLLARAASAGDQRR